MSDVISAFVYRLRHERRSFVAGVQVLALLDGVRAGAAVPLEIFDDGSAEYSNGTFSLVLPLPVKWT
jgi:hypothetical protein